WRSISRIVSNPQKDQASPWFTLVVLLFLLVALALRPALLQKRPVPDAAYRHNVDDQTSEQRLDTIAPYDDDRGCPRLRCIVNATASADSLLDRNASADGQPFKAQLSRIS
ncbi:hypothetical protein K438DRAFT_1817093, partial [Mycena galopus ATCC 62051]